MSTTELAPPKPRLKDAHSLARESLAAMLALEKSFASSGLDERLLTLLKLRASQINGCTYCVDLHVSHLLRIGEDPLRLHHVAVWRESPLYSARERAALAWCESLTRLAETGAPDEDYALLAGQFTPAEQVSLTLAIGAINTWNRLQVGFRVAPPRRAAAA